MAATIFYFTGTGASLAVAKRVAKGLPDATVRSITSYDDNVSITLSGTVGFVFPNYYASIPKPVREFIQRVNFAAVSYCFAILNAGGNPGLGIKHLSELIREKGGDLHYSGFLQQGSNYIVAPYYTAMNFQGEKLRKNLIKNNTFIEKMVEDIRKEERNKPTVSSIGFGVTQLMYGLRLKDNRLNLAKDFSTSEACTGCGICKKVCPVQNIELRAGRPYWKASCEDCCACIQLCNNEAITLHGKSLDKERFIHPEVTVKEIIAGNRVC